MILQGTAIHYLSDKLRAAHLFTKDAVNYPSALEYLCACVFVHACLCMCVCVCVCVCVHVWGVCK